MRYYSFLLILGSSACVDKISFDVPGTPTLNLVVDGHISNLPGPYTITLSSGFDLENKFRQEAITAKKVMITDDTGTQEILTEAGTGIYQTDVTGIQGAVGRVYRLYIELFDGRIYESKPDTMSAPGTLDSIYSVFRESLVADSVRYGFDILFDASSNSNKNFYLQWKFTGTFRVDTEPEGDKDGEKCDFQLDCSGCSYCNLVPKCSGYRNIGSPSINIPPGPLLVKRFPCTCCTCWYTIFNDKPILSNSQLLRAGRFKGISAGYVPVHQWIFQHKVYATINQLSLSRQSYDFWNSIKAQQEGTNSLFQPVTGKIPVNFVQLQGTPTPVQGLFFATSISTKSLQLTRKDVPRNTFNFPLKEVPIVKVCTKLFPNATTTKPSFWVD